MLRIVFTFLIAAAFAQDGDRALELERLTIQERLPFVSMLRVTARHTDGSAARGSISCSGAWFKFQDGPKQEGDWNFPFVTDSTGSIILNPWIGTYEDDPMVCTALDKHGHSGSSSFLLPSRYQEITVH
jgi:hypothetical protein